MFRHLDADETNSIHIAVLEDEPEFGGTAVGTLGLSDHDIGLGSVRVELIGAFPAEFAYAANIAATCAFNAFKDGMPAVPDAIHPRVMELYDSSTPLPHIMLVAPYLWADGPNTVECGELKVAFLMMVPISESERLFALKNGPDALTTLFEEKEIDVFDLRRPSVV